MPAPPPATDLGAPPVEIAGQGVATDYAVALARALGSAVQRRAGPEDAAPAVEWARSGAMALCGPAEGEPRLAPGPLASAARGALRAFEALAGRALDIDGPALLGERAALAGLRRRGDVSPGGGCRLLRCADDWIALSLARPDDARALPAWLESGPLGEADPWPAVRAGLAQRTAADLVARARWLGLAVAAVRGDPPAPPRWLRVAARGTPSPPAAREDRAPRVLDLGTLWAAPLCTHLLERAGARVAKVESAARPDGARRGNGAFFHLLNAGKRSVALDLGTRSGRDRLRGLIERADVVVESARPRALAQLGLDAVDLVAARPGLTWLCLTGHGRDDPAPGRVAFGDDAGVAAGLTRDLGEPPLFCADAIADPLAGLHAAVAVWASWRAGGGHLLDVPLRDVTAHAARFAPGSARGCVEHGTVRAGGACAAVAVPRARRAARRARPLGADTDAVLAALRSAC